MTVMRMFMTGLLFVMLVLSGMLLAPVCSVGSFEGVFYPSRCQLLMELDAATTRLEKLTAKIKVASEELKQPTSPPGR